MSFYIGGGHTGSTTSPPVIGSVAAADSCMLALDYAQNKVGYFSKILWFAHIFRYTDLFGRILLWYVNYNGNNGIRYICVCQSN